MSSKSIYCSCIHCHKEYSVRGIHTHYERTHGTPEQQSKYSDGNNGKYHLISESASIKRREAELKYNENPSLCKHCSTPIPFDKKENQFCNESCAGKFNNAYRVANGYIHTPTWTDEQRKRQSILSKEKMLSGKSSRSICSGYKSKPELAIIEYLQTTYPDDIWEYGEFLYFKQEIISRDVYSKKLKICFEYDGIWHFENICGQLEQKQYKDKLLEEWCIKNEYSLVRIDEDWFKKNNMEAVANIIYSTIDKPQIIKIGNRYIQ